MAKCILRTAKLKGGGSVGGSMSHNYRTRETPNANPALADKNHTYIKNDTYQHAFHRYKDRLSEVTKPRSDSVEVLEYFIGASPEYFQQGGSVDYFNKAKKWLNDKHGADNVIAAGIHFDETTPHMWAYVVPEVDGKLNCKHFTGGRKKLSEMQTDFHRSVGERFGLERGKVGSKAQHTTVKEYYSDMEAAKIMKPAQKLSRKDCLLGAVGIQTDNLKAVESNARLSPTMYASGNRAKKEAKGEVSKLAKREREAAELMKKAQQALELAEQRQKSMDAEVKQRISGIESEAKEKIHYYMMEAVEAKERFFKEKVEPVETVKNENAELRQQLRNYKQWYESATNRADAAEAKLEQYEPRQGSSFRPGG